MVLQKSFCLAQWKHLLVGLSFAILLLNAPLQGQSTGRLSATVTDPSGAVIPGATVSCRNVGTGLYFEATASDEGVVRFPELPIGLYEVTATHEGFQKLVRGDIQLLTGHVLDLRLNLEVGEVTETVEVTGGAPLIQTASSEVQTTFDSRAVEDLPLNGRNPLQLVILTAGASITDAATIRGQQDNRGVTVNGLRSTDNNYRLDGAMFNNRHFGSAPVLPNPDTLQEFTVKAANFGADDSGAGAVVQLSTRSGTNELHGSVFEFLRNDKLDARNFFAADRSPFKRNQYGASIGGPIARNKTFYFASYQGMRQRASPSPKTLTVPSAEQRGGDFSGLRVVADPLTGEPFPNNQIPQSRFDSFAVSLLEIVPLPNQGGLLVVPRDSDQDDEQFLVKIDHLLSDKNHLVGRYFFDQFEFQRDTNSMPGIFADNRFRNQSVSLRDTHTFSASTILTTSFNYARHVRIQTIAAPVTMQDLGANVPLSSEYAQKEIRVFVDGYFRLFGGGPLTFAPVGWEVRAGLNHSRGNHLLRFGIDVQRDVEDAIDSSGGSGNWNFNGSRSRVAGQSASGDSLADLLLGLPQRFTQGASEPKSMREFKFAPWVQDDWRLRPNFTLNLGLRWEPWIPAEDLVGPMQGLLPGVQSSRLPTAPESVVISGDPGISSGVVSNDWNNFAPRIGFAWNLFGSSRTVLRSSYGLFYRWVPLNIQRTAGAVFRAFSIPIPNPASTGDPYTSRPEGNPFPFVSIPESEIANFQFPRNASLGGLDPLASSSYTQSWNFTVEQQLRDDLAFSVGYVGNHSVKIMAAREANPAIFGPGATRGNTNSRRMFPGIGRWRVQAPWQDANYHGLQFSLSKRAARGLNLITNYVFSKTIDNDSNGSVAGVRQRNPFDYLADRGRADFDQTHRANIVFLYDTPEVDLQNALARTVVNNWQVSAIVSMQSGLPFSVRSGRDNALSGINRDHADLIGNPHKSGSVNLEEYFNTAAFIPNATGTFGTAGRNILEGPGLATVDFSIFKSVPITEKLTYQFRWETFNFFNRANFGLPVNTLTSRNFGRILDAGDPRVMQFGMKLIF